MTQSLFQIRVSCYCGFRGEETPRRFFLTERPIDVAEIVDRWLAPDHRYFKVRCSAGHLYILRHDIRRNIWELTMFENREIPPGY